jgi:hypothetical protein
LLHTLEGSVTKEIFMKLLYELKTYIFQRGARSSATSTLSHYVKSRTTYDMFHERPNEILGPTSIALTIDINDSVSDFA